MNPSQPCRLLLFASIAIVLSTGRSTGAVGAESGKQFRVWAVSCSHVPADIRHGRESLAKAIRQSEGSEPDAPGFDWELMIDAGDLSAHQTPPGDRDGQELLRQYRALRKHRREQIYNVPGNHDAPYYDHGPGSWFQKWGDPLGENTEFSGVDPNRRPFPVTGTWERYKFEAGNLLFLMLADRNDAPTPVGRGHSREGKSGGYPPGAVTRDTFEWWKKQVLENQDKIIITMHHHALRDTTVGSGRGEGTPRYHGSTGGAEGSSYLYYIIENEDPEEFRYTKDAHAFEGFLETFHKEHGRGAIDLWVAGHTHVKGPEDNWGGKTISERRWGVGFLQVAALTVHHAGATPLSRLLTFTRGSDKVQLDLYLHEASYNNQPVGWYAPASTTFPLRHQVVTPTRIESLPPFPENARQFEGSYVPPARSSSGRSRYPGQKSLDLLSGWDPQQGGPLALEASLFEDAENRIRPKPQLIEDSPRTAGSCMQFDGQTRLWVGSLDTDKWTDMTISTWIKTRSNRPAMRVVSKDRIGEPGCFMLLHSSPGVWTMRVWDERERKWCSAEFRSDTLSDGQWHHLVGVASAGRSRVQLYIDGQLQGEAAWTAENLDDSDSAPLVIGADSGEKQFGHTFVGRIHDVRLYRQALDAAQIRTLYEGE